MLDPSDPPPTAPPLITYPETLLPAHRQLLIDSAISPKVACARGYYSVTTKSGLEVLGFSERQRRPPAMVIPLWSAATGNESSVQIRPQEPRYDPVRGREIKYEFRRGDLLLVDVHPLIRDDARDPQVPLFLVEGVSKADSAISRGLCCAALLGIWNYRGRNARGGKTVLSDFEFLALNNRDVYVVYDSDSLVNPAVHQALVRLGGVLERFGAVVRYIHLPAGEAGIKAGLDDFFARYERGWPQ
jgi:hypothetical protein